MQAIRYSLWDKERPLSFNIGANWILQAATLHRRKWDWLTFLRDLLQLAKLSGAMDGINQTPLPKQVG